MIECWCISELIFGVVIIFVASNTFFFSSKLDALQWAPLWLSHGAQKPRVCVCAQQFGDEFWSA